MKSRSEYINGYMRDHYKRVALNMKPEDYDTMKTICDGLGVSVNSFINQAISNECERTKWQEDE